MAILNLDNRGVRVSCRSCGTTNRLAHGNLQKTTRCANCKALLPKPDSPVEVPSAQAFYALIAASSIPVVVDFWAPWCGPCRMVAPELEKVAAQAAGEFLIVKVNTDALPELGEQYRVRSIPTMAVFRGGSEVTRTAGARPAADILAFVRQAVLQRAS